MKKDRIRECNREVKGPRLTELLKDLMPTIEGLNRKSGNFITTNRVMHGYSRQ